MPTHGSESYYVIGEGLLGESVGGRERQRSPPSIASARRAGAGPAAAVPPFRFSRLGPKGVEQAARRAQSQEDRRARWRSPAAAHGADPGRLHLPRPVHRPRPDLRQDAASCSATNVSPAAAAAGALAAASTSTRSTAPGRSDPESAKFYEADGLHLKIGQDDRGRRQPGQTASTCRAAPATPTRSQAQGDHPRPAQRREPRGRADPPAR